MAAGVRTASLDTFEATMPANQIAARLIEEANQLLAQSVSIHHEAPPPLLMFRSSFFPPIPWRADDLVPSVLTISAFLEFWIIDRICISQTQTPHPHLLFVKLPLACVHSSTRLWAE